MKKLTAIVAALIALTGCAGRHYVVCAMSADGSGCSHARFNKTTAAQVAALLAGEPHDGDKAVWVIDMNKHEKQAKEVPEVEKPLLPSNTDPKI